MPPAQFERLMNGVRELASERGVAVEPREVTIEVNPDDVTPELCRCWRDAGINRVSMGVQSFDDTLLRAVGRRHDAATAVRAYNWLRGCFDNISIDLIFGLPGQTRESWDDTLDRALDMEAEHISCYCLMYEEGTPLTRLRDAGKSEELPESETVAMFRRLCGRIAGSSYQQYEISNFARPGYESRHNSSYWHGVPYLGIGPSASSYDGARVRRTNNADLRRYVADPLSADGYYEECLSDEELMEEFVLTRMRLREGVPTDDFGRRFGAGMLARFQRGADRMLAAGLVERCGDNIRLTESGILVSDKVILELTL